MSTLTKTIRTFKIPGEEYLFTSTNEYLIRNDYYEKYYSNLHTAISIRPNNEITEVNKLIIGQIRNFGNLVENWDEDGALKIPSESINRAIHWVKLINIFDQNVYFCSPGPNKEILLLLKSENREVELIIYPDREKIVKFDSEEFVEQDNLLPENFISVIDWLTETY